MSVVVCLAVARMASASEEKRPVRAYTNEDLARVSERRGETGVASEPSPGAAAPAPARARSERTARGEEFWRREADRLRHRTEPLRRKSNELEAKLLDRRRQPGVRPYTDALVVSYEAQLQGLRDRIRAEESRFEDRARREGALPGWLR
jgi:hypothetical protein